MVLTILSLVLLIHAWRGRTGESVPFGRWRRPVAVIAGMAVYVMILQRLGYVISTAFLSAVLLWIFDFRSKWLLSVVSAAIALGTFVLFKMLLGVDLPSGIIRLQGIW